MRLSFAGTPHFAAVILDALLSAGHRVAAVYTQPDRPAGRGRRTRPGAVKTLALARGLEVLQPATFRDPAALATLRALECDVMVVAAYGLILPASALDVPTHGCINVHASLLPRWRGAAPVQRAILAGDRETGVCIMRMEEGLDTGPVLASRRTPIAAEDTAGTLLERLAHLGAEALLDVLPRLPAALADATPQDDAAACHAPRIDRAETRLAWAEPAAAVVRRIHAFSPAPGAWTDLPDAPPGARQRETRLRVLRAALEPGDVAAPPGRVLASGSGGFVVACGDGAVRLLEVQPAGGRPMDAASFLNSGRVHTGDTLR